MKKKNTSPRVFRITPQKRFMAAALDEAQKNLAETAGGPFGACLVKDGEILAVARNTVLRDHDPSAHAEINVIRAATRTLGSHQLHDCVIYSTTEPCPMCFSAIHWAGIQALVYGTRIAHVARLGFHELPISNRRMKHLGKSPVQIHAGFARRECLDLLARWAEKAGRPVY